MTSEYSDKGAVPDVNQASEAGEALLDAIKPSDSVADKLQYLSPDKPVYDMSCAKVSSQAMESFKSSLSNAINFLGKVDEPLRHAYNSAKRQEMTCGESTDEVQRFEKYKASVEKVLRETMGELAAEAPFRGAFKVQMRNETLYAFFPPLKTDISENCILFPLHSPNPQREAQLRKDDAAWSSSLSSHELTFRCKVTPDDRGGYLLPRKARQLVS